MNNRIALRSILPRIAVPVLIVPGLIMASGLTACGGSSNYNLTPPVINPPATPPTSSPTLTLVDAFPSLSFTQPVALLQAPHDNSRWFVVERAGRVRVFQNSATATATQTFIDIEPRVNSESGSEMGLLGLAFHPNFPADPRVFVSYTATQSGQTVSRISSFVTNDAGVTLNPTSEQILMTVNQPDFNHKGGNIAFASDGNLFVGFGDGGGVGDPHGTIGNGQSLTTLLGKILRINVDSGFPYTWPATNPFASNPSCGLNGSGSQNCPEIYAYGFRNPWRWSFDSNNGALWVADVGQSAWEEIDQVALGGNYGWRCREGKHDYNTSGCASTGFIDPIWEYGHDVGQSITGGYVYHGTQSIAMQGHYIYGDFVSGRIWSLTPATTTQALQNVELLDSSAGIASFAQANDGELYLVDFNGRLYRLSFQ